MARAVLIRPDAARYEVVLLDPRQGKLEQVQVLLAGGPCTSIDHRHTGGAAYTAYHNGDPSVGPSHSLNLLARHMLEHLHFLVQGTPMVGTVVVLGPKGRALSDKALAAIDKAYELCCAHDDDSDSADVPRPVAKRPRVSSD
jgi:hypothetical protein